MTAPPVVRQFVAGEIEAAAFLNGLGSVVNFLMNPPRCKVQQVSPIQSLTNNVWTAVTWDTEAYDTDAMHNPASNNTRLVATTSGLYTMKSVIGFTGNATGIRGLQVRKNAAGNVASGTQMDGLTNETSLTANNATVEWLGEVQMSVGDYLEVFAFQNCGGGMSLVNSSGITTWASMRWVAST